MQRMKGDMELWTPSVDAFYRQLVEKFATIPGVEAVTAAGTDPSRVRNLFSFTIQGRPVPIEADRLSRLTEVRPGYFDLLHIPLHPRGASSMTGTMRLALGPLSSMKRWRKIVFPQ